MVVNELFVVGFISGVVVALVALAVVGVLALLILYRFALARID